MEISKTQATALETIHKLRKYPIPETTERAVKRILSSLTLQDYTAVAVILADESGQVSRG
jgi:hypothetical protein